MSTGRFTRWTFVVACVAALALLSAEAYSKRTPAPIHNISLRVKNGNLVCGGVKNRSVQMKITPVQGGMRVVGTSGTRINGKTKPIVLTNVTRDWIFLFRRTGLAVVTVEPPAEGVAPLRPRTVAFAAPHAARFQANGLRIRKHLKLDLRRTWRFATVALEDTTVGGKLIWKQDHGPVDFTCTDVKVGKIAKLLKKEGLHAEIHLERCEFPFLEIGCPKAPSSLTLIDSTVSSNLRVFGMLNRVEVSNLEIAGDLQWEGPPERFQGNIDGHQLSFAGLEVGGVTRISLGPDDNVVTIADSQFGTLDVVGGIRNDTLSTTGVTATAGGTFDGALGDADRWVTDDETLLETIAVEDVGAPPTTE